MRVLPGPRGEEWRREREGERWIFQKKDRHTTENEAKEWRRRYHCIVFIASREGCGDQRGDISSKTCKLLDPKVDWRGTSKSRNRTRPRIRTRKNECRIAKKKSKAKRGLFSYLEFFEVVRVPGPVDLREEVVVEDLAEELEEVDLDLVEGLVLQQLVQLRLPLLVVERGEELADERRDLPARTAAPAPAGRVRREAATRARRAELEFLRKDKGDLFSTTVHERNLFFWCFC